MIEVSYKDSINYTHVHMYQMLKNGTKIRFILDQLLNFSYMYC